MKLMNLGMIAGLVLLAPALLGQGNPPWNNDLMMAWSPDGVNFGAPSVFQDSAGVPSVIRWHGDTLVAAFQWFRQPNPSPTWDRVATKFSYDNGQTWTAPVPIVMNGLPSNYQRPFDPTLVTFGGDSLRVYYSSSLGVPMGGLDSTVNTYSAWSVDGIHFNFEANARVDVLQNRVIDPAVVHFGQGWHYLSPIGAPQQGAYHYVSPDGLNFSAVPSVPSDNQHNWTGNYTVVSGTELRFYGSGPSIWYNSTPNGGMWNGYVNTNVQGGDPSVLRVADSSYLMVYVGVAPATAVAPPPAGLRVHPNPARLHLVLEVPEADAGRGYGVYSALGVQVHRGRLGPGRELIDVALWPRGVYLLRLDDAAVSQRFVKE